MANGDGFDQYGNIRPGFIPTYSDSGVHGAERRNMGLGGNFGQASPNYFEHPSWQARNAASKGQGFGNEMSGVDMQLGDFTRLNEYIKDLEARYKNIGSGDSIKPSSFGLNIPTLGVVGDIFGAGGKFMSGLGALRVADTARDSYEEKKKYNKLNWGQQLLKRAGEVSGENALRRDDNAYRTAQGIGHLAEMIPA